VSQHLNLKVINLWAAPGIGKSTAAAGLFNLMKARGMNVELVTEAAKDLTYERNFPRLNNQLHVLAEQDLRLRRLEGRVEWAITDSPLPQGLAYITDEYKDWLVAATWGAYDRYNNFDILLQRNPLRPYTTVGRNQTEDESKALDETILSLFNEAVEGDEDYAMQVESNVTTPYHILRWIGDGQ